VTGNKNIGVNVTIGVLLKPLVIKTKIVNAKIKKTIIPNPIKTPFNKFLLFNKASLDISENKLLFIFTLN